MTRRVVAVTVIAIWVVGLGMLYRRNTIRTPEQQLTEAGLRVSPEAYYYILLQGDKQVGAAASTIDTTTTRIVSVDFVRGAVPVGNDTLRIEARSEARYTRGMRLQDFLIRADGDLTPFTLRGLIQEGESKTLRVTADTKGEKPLTQESVPEHAVFLPTMAPLPLMLRKAPRVGDSLVVSMYDPVGRTVRNVTLKVQADSLFLIADSASLDSASGRWVRQRQDSVRGWRLGGASSPITAWVDASGRLVAASEPGGISLVRTAFELAFENWRLDNPAGAQAAAGIPGRVQGRTQRPRPPR